MSFFDTKEEIIKLELTTYGKFLLSRGKFKPVYYAFFDDDVLYDVNYANITEGQNSTQNRILNETPNLKPQTTFSSVEKHISLNKDLLFREIEQLKYEQSQISSDKNYALSLPIGNSAYNNNYAPAWSISLVSASISSSVPYLENEQNSSDILSPFLKIPQLNLEDRIANINILYQPTDEELSQQINIGNSITFVSGNYYVCQPNLQSFFDIRENNVINLNENFDIEIFVELTKSINVPNEQPITSSYWHQLDFKKKNIQVENGILLDSPKYFSTNADESMVEYYFNLTVDKEIIDAPEFDDKRGTYLSNIVPANAPFGDDC